MKIKKVIRAFNLLCNLVVVISLLLLLIFPGFLLSITGFHLIMRFFWLGEKLHIFEAGTYNDKHDLMLEVLKPYREMIRMGTFAKRATKKDAP